MELGAERTRGQREELRRQLEARRQRRVRRRQFRRDPQAILQQLEAKLLQSALPSQKKSLHPEVDPLRISQASGPQQTQIVPECLVGSIAGTFLHFPCRCRVIGVQPVSRPVARIDGLSDRTFPHGLFAPHTRAERTTGRGATRACPCFTPRGGQQAGRCGLATTDARSSRSVAFSGCIPRRLKPKAARPASPRADFVWGELWRQLDKLPPADPAWEHARRAAGFPDAMTAEKLRSLLVRELLIDGHLAFLNGYGPSRPAGPFHRDRVRQAVVRPPFSLPNPRATPNCRWPSRTSKRVKCGTTPKECSAPALLELDLKYPNLPEVHRARRDLCLRATESSAANRIRRRPRLGRRG